MWATNGAGSMVRKKYFNADIDISILDALGVEDYQASERMLNYVIS